MDSKGQAVVGRRTLGQSWGHPGSERVSTLLEATQPAVSRTRNITKIKGFLLPCAFLVDCKGPARSCVRSLSSSFFQKIRSHFSFALPRCKQPRGSPVFLSAKEELTFQGARGKGVDGPHHRGQALRPVSHPEVAGFTRETRKPRLREGVPSPGSAGSQHVAESVDMWTSSGWVPLPWSGACSVLSCI